MVPDAILARLHAKRPEVIEEYPRADRMPRAEGQRAAHGEGSHRSDLRLDHVLHRARGLLLELGRRHDLSTLMRPGPKANTISMPPVIARFFRKLICWFIFCAASTAQKLWKRIAARSVKTASASAAQRAL